ncbi:hypothetical protein ACQRD4_07380 [Streptococcus hyointestinalis]|uniref:hypothetical protein n=1 Tax=Streptococcus hyointestinalis TaxID=1337 RepID=UPI003D0830D8
MIDFYKWQDTQTKQALPLAEEMSGKLSPEASTEELYQLIYHFQQEFGERATLTNSHLKDEKEIYALLDYAKSVFSSEQKRQIYDQKLGRIYVSEGILPDVKTIEPPRKQEVKRNWLLISLIGVFLVLSLFLFWIWHLNLFVLLIFMLIAIALILYFMNG